MVICYRWSNNRRLDEDLHPSTERDLIEADELVFDRDIDSEEEPGKLVVRRMGLKGRPSQIFNGSQRRSQLRGKERQSQLWWV